MQSVDTGRSHVSAIVRLEALVPDCHHDEDEAAVDMSNGREGQNHDSHQQSG